MHGIVQRRDHFKTKHPWRLFAEPTWRQSFSRMSRLSGSNVVTKKVVPYSVFKSTKKGAVIKTESAWNRAKAQWISIVTSQWECNTAAREFQLRVLRHDVMWYKKWRIIWRSIEEHSAKFGWLSPSTISEGAREHKMFRNLRSFIHAAAPVGSCCPTVATHVLQRKHGPGDL